MSGRKTKFFYLVAFLLIVSSQLSAQTVNPYKKGRMFAYWGWNRGAFSNSDITMRGDDYSLKLFNVRAHDKLTKPFFNYNDYFKPDRITIPQTNVRVGYFFKDNWALSLGIDHMKYVMDKNQEVKVDGEISREGAYKGVYNNANVVLTEDFLTFEHTDGLNYVNAELERYRRLGSFFSDNLSIGVSLGGGLGALVPKTNAKFLDYARNDRFHLSGFGADVKAVVDIIAFKHLNLRFEAKQGYINMPNIVLHEKGINGKAKQAFWFTQFAGTIGVNFGAFKF